MLHATLYTFLAISSCYATLYAIAISYPLWWIMLGIKHVMSTSGAGLTSICNLVRQHLS